MLSFASQDNFSRNFSGHLFGLYPRKCCGTFTSTLQIICPVNFAINGLAPRNIKNEAMLLLKNKNLIYFHAELFPPF